MPYERSECVSFAFIKRSDNYKGSSNFNAVLTPLTFLISYFNSACNPLLYGFMSKNFRKGFRELFCRTERRIIIGGEPYQPRTDTAQVGNWTLHLYNQNQLRSNRCQQTDTGRIGCIQWFIASPRSFHRLRAPQIDYYYLLFSTGVNNCCTINQSNHLLFVFI